MRLSSIFIQNFRGFSSASTMCVEPGLNVVVGANGQGKSSLLNAIEWCLFGREIEKSSSGLVERKAWQVANRYAAREDTVVRLMWLVNGGEIRMARVRELGGRRSQEDLFQIELPTGELFSGASAAAWATAHGFPSWADWRSSFCQHQEAARDRLLTKENRTAALVALLGLHAVASFKAEMDGLKLLTARRAIKAAEERIAADLELLQSSSKDLDSSAQGLQARGVDPGSVTLAGALGNLEALRESAGSMAARLGMPSSIQGPFADLDKALRWADAWPSDVRQRPPSAVTDVSSLRRQAGELEAAIEAMEPLESSISQAKEELDRSIQLGGDAETRSGAAQDAQSQLQQIEEQRKANNRIASLLADARAVISDRGGDHCPVCQTAVRGLDDVISQRLEDASSSQARELDEASSKAQAALQSARDAVTALQALQARVDGAVSSLSAKQQLLRGFVPGFEGPEVAAAARSRLEEIRRQIKAEEELQQDLDHQLSQHRDVYDDARAKARYLEALDRQDHHIDVEELPAWAAYNDALDDLVALITDCEALAIMAKDVLACTSDEKLGQVNETLGSYYQMITGGHGDDDRGLKVVSHSTAKMLDYRIVDDRGEDLVPILNQASLNAISIALLFAQADGEEAAGPSLLVLDDPEQSLDEHHVAGLARALDKAAQYRDILIGITPARLEKRLRDYSTSAKHFHYLEGWTTSGGAVLSA